MEESYPDLETIKTLLVECFNKHGCDKSRAHNYENVYGPILHSLIMDHKDGFLGGIRILEIGVYRGDSIKAFIDFFDTLLIENYGITGIDIFKRVYADKIEVLNHPKVKWFKTDSTDKNQIPFEKKKFDLIIDDGLHTFDGQRQTFENYYPFLDNGGYYVIEDIWPFHLMTDKEIKSHRWMRKYWEHFDREKYQKLTDTLKDSGGEIQAHDLRDLNGHADSFCFEIIKQV